MENIRVVYTPDISLFGINDSASYVYQDNSRVIGKKLRLLRTRIPDTPDYVGIISTLGGTKLEFRRAHEEINNPSTYYTPLAIFDEALALMDNPIESGVDADYRRRGLSRMFSNIALSNLCTTRLPELELGVLSAIPVYLRLRKEVVMYRDEAYLEKNDPFLRELGRLVQILPGCERIRFSHQVLEDKFKKNKINRNFPLFFVPSNLKNQPLRNIFYPFFLDIKLRPNEVVAEDIQQFIDSHDQLFQHMNQPPTENYVSLRDNLLRPVVTINVCRSLEKLLERLPEPKTIITDVYIVDHFPELEGRFHACEFQLAQTAA
ncbi:MAG: hypothetical protein ABIH37_03495 [archaeon]